MNNVSEFTTLRYGWGNDLENRENRELKLEEDIEDRFLAHKFENRRIASKIDNQNVIFYNCFIKYSIVITLTIKG